MTIALRYAARSDVGLLRSNNQDSAYAGEHLLAVADGMGGHAGGDIASSIVIARLAELDAETPANDIVAALENVILDANDALLQRAQDEPALAGLGTTVTALLRTEGKFALAHIGDSRGYLLRGDSFTQVTKDHTLVQRLMDEGRLTAEEAEHHPHRSAVLKVLGDVDSDPDLDMSLRPAHPGDRWLLCSDGLSGPVSDSTLEQTLREFSDVGECADKLIELALKGGGPDNVTCIVADVLELDDLPAGMSPSHDVQVVGSAAANCPPRSSASSSASRAADLLRTEEPEPLPEEPEDAVQETAKRSAWPAVIVSVLLASLLAILVWFGMSWVRTQYFVGSDGTNVVIYRGINQDLGSFPLYEPEATTQIKLSDLPQAYQRQVSDTIPADSRGAADRIVESLTGLSTAQQTPAPIETPSSAPAPTASREG
ncbi:PP2C family protein-serine/threonine phosphatase [Dermabacteraceae bacterium P13115]